MIDVSTPRARDKFYHSGDWRRVREQVLKRDNKECQWCKAEGRVTTAKTAMLEIDHIKELQYYPELALEPSNLRTLCHDCHNIRHNRHKDKQFDDETFEF
ncbi:HNH endonuclease [Lactococcus cremoris]|uniref:Putative HNH nuclease YajD n=1 Tax=Lactococcus lactis subsp. cremoris TaxID=1359 RepID=A0AAX4AKP2_LACLC|nr:HNH endonuclease [Lactococcus cremoris]WMX71735.1 HNH endonuclease [Lactococcus cremoris]